MKRRVSSVTNVPRTRPQRTPPPDPANIDEAWPTNAKGWHAPPPTSTDGIGRFPTIGIDTGHIPGTRPDQRY